MQKKLKVFYYFIGSICSEKNVFVINSKHQFNPIIYLYVDVSVHLVDINSINI